MIERAWLIEWPIGEPYSYPEWWGKTIQGFGRTPEPGDAIRFCRKEDAEAVIVSMGWNGSAVALEHQWDDGVPDYLAPLPMDIEAGRILRGHTKSGCLCRYCKAVLSGRIVLNG